MNDQVSLIDTHTHLASSRFSGVVAEVVDRARANGVSKLVAIACDLEDSETNLKLAEQFEDVAPTVGVHPLYVHEIEPATWVEQLAVLARNPAVVALGEMGLDYFHPPQNGSGDEEWRSLQRDVFETQLQIATETGLPVVIHQRESASDVAGVLAQFPGVKAVLHCFSGTRAQAEEALSRGHYLSFTGIVTFPSAADLREVARSTPLDRIMVETDSPYLAPVPYRGKQCEPFMVRHTADCLAALHGISPAEMAAITTRNAREFFRHL